MDNESRPVPMLETEWKAVLGFQWWAVLGFDYDEPEDEAVAFPRREDAEAYRQTRDQPAAYKLLRLALIPELPAVATWWEGESCIWWDSTEGGGIPGPWLRQRSGVAGIDQPPTALEEREELILGGSMLAYRVRAPQRQMVVDALTRWRLRRVSAVPSPIDGLRPMPKGTLYSPPYAPAGVGVEYLDIPAPQPSLKSGP